MIIAGGSFIFALFLIVFLAALAYGLFTTRGSGISQRPYNKMYGGAPGAHGASRLSGRRPEDVKSWTRGAR
ncbi:MAG TPA: hypothetical protein VIL64_03640 [Solirubrobacteraceae bacterium]